MNTKKCSRCEKDFLCGNPDLCWCSDFPKIMPLDSTDDCMCKECLIELQNEKITTFLENNTLEQNIKMAAEYYDPDNLIENLDYSIENGKWIFSEWFLLKRGFCCDNGCANCPYND